MCRLLRFNELCLPFTEARAAPCALLAALLGAIALENGDPSSVGNSTPRLFRSLELLEDPLRSKVSWNILEIP